MKLLIVPALCIAVGSAAPTAGEAQLERFFVQSTSIEASVAPLQMDWKELAASIEEPLPLGYAPTETPALVPAYYEAFESLPVELVQMIVVDRLNIEFEELIETCELTPQQTDSSPAIVSGLLLDCAIYRSDFLALDALWHRSYLMKEDAQAKMEQWRELRVDHADKSQIQHLQTQKLFAHFASSRTSKIALRAYLHDEELINDMYREFGLRQDPLDEAILLYKAVRDASPEQLQELKGLVSQDMLDDRTLPFSYQAASIHPSYHVWSNLKILFYRQKLAIGKVLLQVGLITNRKHIEKVLDNALRNEIRRIYIWMLKEAAEKDNLRLLEALDKRKAKIEGFDHAMLGEALFDAAKKGSVKAARFLVNKMGVDVEAKDDEGSTALMFASHEGHIAMVKLLVEEAHANIDEANSKAFSILSIAILKGHVDIAENLLGKGADPRIGLFHGKTTLDLAVKKGEESLARKIRDKIAELEEKEKIIRKRVIRHK